MEAITLFPFFFGGGTGWGYNIFSHTFYIEQPTIILNDILYLYCFQNIPCNENNKQIRREPADGDVDQISQSKINRSMMCTWYDIDLEANLILDFSSSDNSKKYIYQSYFTFWPITWNINSWNNVNYFGLAIESRHILWSPIWWPTTVTVPRTIPLVFTDGSSWSDWTSNVSFENPNTIVGLKDLLIIIVSERWSNLFL